MDTAEQILGEKHDYKGSGMPESVSVLFVALGFAAGFYNTEICLQVKALLDAGAFEAEKLVPFVRRLGSRVINLAWAEFEAAKNRDVSVVTPLCAAYPRDLWEIADPPLALFVRGTMAGRFRVGVVGSRRATEQAMDTAFLLGRTVVENGGTVVSGLAYGVDKSAHDGAICAHGVVRSEQINPGIAVLGSGVCHVYPSDHYQLSEELVARGGAVVSEYGVTLEPRAHYFPRRNRIISGLSRAVVIVQASERSGSLITARLALEQGRDVFSVPGPFSSKGCAGSNALIKCGAQVVCSPEDVLETIPKEQRLTRDKNATIKSNGTFSSSTKENHADLSYREFFNEDELVEADRVISTLELVDACEFDKLQLKTGIEATRLSKILGMLELGGAIKVLSSGEYQLTIDS